MRGWSQREHNSPQKLLLTVLLQVKELAPDQAEKPKQENNEVFCVTLCMLTLSNQSLTQQFEINQAA